MYGQARPEVLMEAGRERVVSILREAGIPASGSGRSLTVALGGQRATLVCEAGDLRLLATFGSAELGKVNEWNRTHRFSRAFVDESGKAVLASDLDMGGGVTKDAIAGFARRFGESAAEFRGFVGKRTAK